MYLGIDHGTSAIRFATESGHFKVSREEARDFRLSWIEDRLPGNDRIDAIALTYSMGDRISSVTPVSKVINRGIITREGAGKHVGGGTRVFDEVSASGIPAYLIPGLHRNSPTDPRFKAYSHQSSPEKIGIAYKVYNEVQKDCIISDVSSNTVSLLIMNGRIVGAIDACIFAPGTEHFAIDVDAIRNVENSINTANEAYQRAGVRYTVPPALQDTTLALWVAMECAALQILSHDAVIALAGSMAPIIAKDVSILLKKDLKVYDEWSASEGLSEIARFIHLGGRDVLGIPVDF